MITPAVLDAQLNLILSHITMSVNGCTTYLLLSGDMLLFFHRELISYMTWSPGCSHEAFNVGLLRWASLTPLLMPIINTVEMSGILGTLVIV